jgi:hypothetical protein
VRVRVRVRVRVLVCMCACVRLPWHVTDGAVLGHSSTVVNGVAPLLNGRPVGSTDTSKRMVAVATQGNGLTALHVPRKPSAQPADQKTAAGQVRRPHCGDPFRC